MADKIIETILAQIDSDLLIEEVRRRMGLLPGVVGEGGQQANSMNGTAQAPARDSYQTGVVRPDEFFRLSNPEAIRKFLGIMKRPQNPRAIVEGLKAGGVLSNAKNFYATIWTELTRARARGELVNTPSGWGLSEWYPGRAKPVPEAKKGKKKRSSPSKKKSQKIPAPANKEDNAQPRSKGDEYRAFVAEHRHAGKGLKEISQLWRVKNDLEAGHK